MMNNQPDDYEQDQDLDNDLDKNDDSDSADLDETESVSLSSESDDTAPNLTDADLAEAESLTVTAKQSIRAQLEDEVARFLAQGGKITEVPADETIRD